VDECVFELNVSVDDILPMAIIQCNYELLEKPSCLVLVESALFANILKGIPSICIFHSNAQIVLGQENL
jgi:hypothetical protein